MNADEMSQGMQDVTNMAIGLLSAWGISVIGAVALLIVGRFVAGWIRSSITKGLTRAGTDASLIPFFASMAYYVVLAVVLIAVLNLFGIETTSLIAVVGAAGLAVGLALQGTLSNFAAGVMLLIFRPIRVGDFVETCGFMGTIKEIAIFNTILTTGDNKTVILPNGAVSNGAITNFSAQDTRRVDIVFGVGYDADLKQAKEVLAGLIRADERILKDPEPLIVISALGDSAVDITTRSWVNSADYWAVYFELMENAKVAFDNAGINIPYPQTDVHLHQVP